MSSLPSLVRLAILDSYGVEWPLATFARDVLQNFFDVALSFRDVVIDRDDAARTLEIRGPLEFDLDLLAYVGATTKLDGKTAGGFGEGFKICALVGVRDHGLAIRAGSGETEIEVTFEPVQLGRELCYRVHDAPGRKGSFVRLEGCTDAIFAAFETARDQFFHADNPHLGALVAADEAGTVAVHLAAEGAKHGEIYYRRQFRGEIAYGTSGHRAGPVKRVTFACHHSVDYLEGDRDRRTLEPESVARAVGERLPPEALFEVFLVLQGEWHQWHEITAGLLRAAIERKLRFEWPHEWFARSSDGRDHALGRAAERKGFKEAIPAFSAIGMQTAKDVVRLGKAMTHTPTAPERERIDVAAALYAALCGDDPPSAAWQVIDTKRIEATHAHHDGRDLTVPARLLAADAFALGTGTMLHELAHEFGAEDSPAFLRRLGRMIGGAIRDPSAVEAARARYERPLPKGHRVVEVEAVEPYKPEYEKDPAGGPRHKLVPSVYVLPGFPGTAALVDRLREGAAVAGFGCYPCVLEMWTSADAKREKLHGLPCVKFGDVWVDAKGATGRPSLRLRTYGPERDVLPSVEMVAFAVRAYMDAARARSQTVQTPEYLLSTRDMMARHYLDEWVKKTMAKGPSRAQIEVGLSYACAIHMDAVKKGVEQTYEELFAVVRDDVLPMLAAADAHLAAQTDVDRGDGFEEGALSRAHTVFIAGLAAGGASMAARDFAIVREATKELLAADLGAEMRESVLDWCLTRAGMKTEHLRVQALAPLDEAAFRAAMASSLGEARRIQSALDLEERGLRWYELERRLENAMRTPEERDTARAAKVTQSAASALWMRHYRMRNAMTHTIKETWERTLAATGSATTAGEACIALLRRLEKQIAAEQRHAKKGAA